MRWSGRCIKGAADLRTIQAGMHSLSAEQTIEVGSSVPSRLIPAFKFNIHTQKTWRTFVHSLPKEILSRPIQRHIACQKGYTVQSSSWRRTGISWQKISPYKIFLRGWLCRHRQTLRSATLWRSIATIKTPWRKIRKNWRSCWPPPAAKYKRQISMTARWKLKNRLKKTDMTLTICLRGVTSAASRVSKKRRLKT